jgi:hypothetical protein
MTWDDEGLSARYTAESYGAVLSLLTTGDHDSEIAGLETLADTLAYGDANLLSSFPIQPFCQQIVRLLGSSAEPIQERASLCVFNVLEAHPQSTRELINAGCLEQMRELMVNHAPINVIGNLLRAADVISQYQAGNLARRVGIAPLLDYFDFLGRTYQRTVAKTIAQIVSNAMEQSFVGSLGQLLLLALSADAQIAQNSVQSFCQIAEQTDQAQFPLAVIPTLCEVVVAVADQRAAARMISILANLSKLAHIAEAIVAANLNFERLLLSPESHVSKNDVIEKGLMIVLNLLPTNKVPQQLLPREPFHPLPPNVSQRFAESIQGILVRCLTEHIGFENLLVVAVTLTFLAHPQPVPGELITLMCGLAQRQDLTPFVLFFASSVQDPAIPQSGLLFFLQKSQGPTKWYTKTLRALTGRKGAASVTVPQLTRLRTLVEVLTTIRDAHLGAYHLMQDGFFKHVTGLVASAGPTRVELFRPLIAHSFEIILCLLGRPPIQDPFGGQVDRFKGHQFGLEIEHEKGNMHYSYYALETFVGAEAIYNYNKCGVSHQGLAEAHRQAGPICDICPMPPNLGDLTCAEIGYYHRVFRSPAYKTVSVTFNGKKLSVKDSILRHLSATHRGGTRGNTSVKIADAKVDWWEPMTKLDIPLDAVDEKVLVVLRLLEAIHTRWPMVVMESERFESRIFAGLKSPYLTIALQSPEIQIASNFPYLFSFPFRQYIISLTSSDVYHALNAFCLRMEGHLLQEPRNHVKCFIRRDSLFQDGIALMERVAVTPLQFALEFVGEEAVGTGPVQEFLTLFTKELAQISRGMWRNAFDNPGPLVFHEQGLFPLYSADERLFFLLGVLCAKAVQMRFIVPLPFNVAFFKLVKGQRVTLAEVDRTLAESLASSEGLEGLPFILPGTDQELIKDGCQTLVTAANFELYRDAITDFVCGGQLRKVVAAFKKGFKNLFQPGCFDFVSASELAIMISGSDSDVTLEDLETNIDFSNGYILASPQMKMLFEIILEMSSSQRALFFKFVTGCDRLPIGGLSGLHPRLNIAKKVGCDLNSLPSAMTCKNYFKLPAYETKAVMVHKLLFAIEEGQGQLLLT